MPVVLYRRQRQVLDFIVQYIQKHGHSPSLREIADAVGLNAISTVHEHIAALERKGVLKRNKDALAGLEIIDENIALLHRAINLPVLGLIAAGKPIEPYNDPQATMQVPNSMISGKKRAFLLQVKGDSMVEDGILDGDYVVVEEGSDINNGDVVVALLENGLATLKKFFKEATRVRLEPANSKMSPIFATHVQIQGKVVGLIRRF